jgi:hypothetical protein
VVELTTTAELKSGEAKGVVESRTEQLGGGISWGYGAYERTVGAITFTIAFAASEATVVCHFGCVRDNCYA